MVDDTEFVSVLCGRIKQHLCDFIDRESSSDVIGKFCGLNSRLSIYKYSNGGIFEKHRDCCTHLENPNRMSHYTVMMYLNTVDQINGGRTRFYSDASGEVVDVVSPKAGSILIFDHRLLYDEEKFSGTCKYILRSDALFLPTQRAEL
jgi:hypothetical protein